jgi:hypothetical protein
MPISTRALMIIAIVALIAVAVAAIAAWWVTRQPPLIPVNVPSVAQA